MKPKLRIALFVLWYIISISVIVYCINNEFDNNSLLFVVLPFLVLGTFIRTIIDKLAPKK